MTAATAAAARGRPRRDARPRRRARTARRSPRPSSACGTTRSQSLRVDLRTWLDRSVEGQAQWEPHAFELAFGLPAGPGRDARSIREEVTLDGGWRLRGIVDLVERRRGAPGFRVTDHKTGLNRTAAGLVVGKGEALQPVLYGLAVERIFGEPVAESRL